MTTNEKITQADVLGALSSVMDPELHKDIVTLNMISNIEIDGGDVSFRFTLTTGACPLKKELEDNAISAVEAIDGVKNVEVIMDANVAQSQTDNTEPREEGGCGGGQKGSSLPPKQSIPGVKNTIAVASGKGGVGKSTVSVNLAIALAKSGKRVGLLDTDLYGPSIPLMMGINEELQATEGERLVPLVNHGVKLISVGFMLDEEQALIWRGPLIMQLVKQFLLQVDWGELDYLVIDLPPGTGDAQLTLVQTIPLSGALIVTTPQDVALIDARRAIKMFGEVNVPVVGIVENMSYFTCPHCHKDTEIFSSGGGQETSERYDVALLGKIPLDPVIREGGDSGKPITEAAPDSEHAKIFIKISEAVVDKLSALALA